MTAYFSDLGREIIWLDPSAVGLVIALFVAAFALVLYLYLRNRREGLLWRIKASVISALISGTVAAPFLYLFSNCLGVCGL